MTLYKLCEETELTEQQGILLARNLCRAVAELHSIGLVHGDIASENVLIDSATWDVKLIDFDLTSKVGSSVSAAGNPDFIT
jgi:serine/threonine protein kinase